MNNNGFNLVELCICMLMIAILSSGSYYGYQRYHRSLARKTAELVLEDMALSLEHYKDKIQGYQNLSLDNLGFSAADAYYTYHWKLSKSTYLVSADPLIPDDCGILSLNEQGMRISKGAVQSCW